MLFIKKLIIFAVFAFLSSYSSQAIAGDYEDNQAIDHYNQGVTYHKQGRIDVAVTTNGVLLKEKLAANILGSLSWIKISIDAGTKETYSKIHQCPEKHFDIVLNNLKIAVKIRNANGYNCTIGAQTLLLPENFDEMVILAKELKNIGVDYLVIKPHSQYPLSLTSKYNDLHYSQEETFKLIEQLENISDKQFKIIVRQHTMRKLSIRNRGYQRCLAVPFFWAYIDSHGDIYTCSAYLTDPRFLLGNYRTSFKELWESEKRKKMIEFIANDLDVSKCRINCRMDEANRYLWDMKNPSCHVNFI